MGYEHLGTVLHTGLQTLAILGVGWATAKWQLLQQAGTDSQIVTMLNVLIMRVCLPALQLLLLAVQTDMRHMHNWRILAAFMLWTAIIQTAVGVWVLIMEDGRLDRWGAHALVLVANNTGVLAPVVLDAALGEGVGYIGMLATVCLYFQQLPVSEAFMAAGQAANPMPGDSEAGHAQDYTTPTVSSTAQSKVDPWSGSVVPAYQFHNQPHTSHGQPNVSSPQSPHESPHGKAFLTANQSPSRNTAAGYMPAGTQTQAERQTTLQADAGQRGNYYSSVKELGELCHRGSVQHQQQQHLSWQQGNHPDRDRAHDTKAGHEAEGSMPLLPVVPEIGLSWLGLLFQNPLVWTTGLASMLSAAGSCEYLAPGGKHTIHQLAFVSGSLEWLARCSVPLTLLSTGVWLCGRRQLLGGDNSRMVAVYLLLKLFVLPWLMVVITHIMGIGGRHGMALLLLTVVPVGQTAFVLSERYRCCTEAITATLIAGLLLLLPHLLLVIWVEEKLGLYPNDQQR